VSTVLEFMGLLKNADGEQMPPSVLVRTGRKSQLPSLEGVLFNDLSLKDAFIHQTGGMPSRGY